jgi:transposase
MTKGNYEAATVAATRSEAMPRIEIVADRRRAHSAAFRARVVAEASAAGVRVQDVARRHGVCPSIIYRWRRAGETDGAGGSSLRLFPVQLTDDSAESPSAPPSPSCPPATGRRGLIEIELAGDVRVRVDETVSLVALRRVMSVLRG